VASDGRATVVRVVDRLAEGGRDVVIVCDFSPPRGADPQLLEPSRRLGADFISVAYNPGRSTRVISALAAHWIKENAGKDVVFTLATRDMNKVSTQSLLLGAALLGLENVVVVRGDEFTERELESVKPVHDYAPTELVRSIGSMNEGLDYRGRKLRSSTSFCVGATIDLGHAVEPELRLTRRKVDAGAQFFLLQTLFDPQPLQEFLAAYTRAYGEELRTPIFCGVQVMTSESIVFGDVPPWVRGDLDRGRPGDEIAVQVLQRFLDEGFRSIYLVPPILKGGRRDYAAAQRVIEAHRG